jgi:hypothetical protein
MTAFGREHFSAMRRRRQACYDCRRGTAFMSTTPDDGPTARASGEPDPIFASIQRHRAALQGWLVAYDRLGKKGNDCIAAPESIEGNKAFLAATEELDKALETVVSTSPTTIIGVADLFDYIDWYRCEPLAPILNYAFLPLIAATLSRGTTRESDPIFVSIERHRAASGGWLAAIERRSALREMIPVARRRWEAGERPHFCTDAPEWIEVNTALIASYEELKKALEVVLSTPPATLAGVTDLPDYVGREGWEVAGVDEWADEPPSSSACLNVRYRGVR